MNRRIQIAFDTGQTVSTAKQATEAVRGLERGFKEASTASAQMKAAGEALARQAAPIVTAYRQQSQALLENIKALKAGPEAMQALQNAREQQLALAKAGVDAESRLGKAIISQVSNLQNLRREMAETVAAQAQEAQASAQATAEAQRNAQARAAQTAAAVASINSQREVTAGLLAELVALKQGPEALAALAAGRERETALARAGVDAESRFGQAILAQLAAQQRLRQALRETTEAKERERQATAAATAAAEKASSALASERSTTQALQQDLRAEQLGVEAKRQLNLERTKEAALLRAGVVAESAAGQAILREVAAQQSLRQATEAVVAARAKQAAAVTSLRALQQHTAAMLEDVRALKLGPAAVIALNNARERQAALAAAGVTAESRLGQAILAQINAQQRLKVETDSIVAAHQKQAQAAGQATDSSGKLRSVLQTLVPAATLAGIVALGNAAVKMALDVNTSLTQIVTLTGVSQQQVQAWGKDFARIGLEAGKGPAELARAMYLITGAGQRGADAILILDKAAKASAVGLGDTATIAKALTAELNAYSKEGLTAAQATDILIATVREGNVEADALAPVLGRVAGLAQQAGVSFAETGAFIATFTRLGVDADEAVTALRGTLSALLGPTKQQNEALASIGLTMAGLKQEIRDKGLTAALVDLVGKFKGNDDALSLLIPNVRALSGVLGTAGAQGEEFVKIAENIRQSIGSTTEEAFKLADATPGQALAQMSAAAQQLAQVFGDAVLPALREVSLGLKDGLQGGLKDAARELGTITGAGLKILAETLLTVANHIDLVKAAMVAFIAVKLLDAFTSWTRGAVLFGQTLDLLRAKQYALIGANLGTYLAGLLNPITLVVVAVGSLTYSIGKLAELERDSQKATAELAKAMDEADPAHRRNRDVVNDTTKSLLQMAIASRKVLEAELERANVGAEANAKFNASRVDRNDPNFAILAGKSSAAIAALTTRLQQNKKAIEDLRTLQVYEANVRKFDTVQTEEHTQKLGANTGALNGNSTAAKAAAAAQKKLQETMEEARAAAERSTEALVALGHGTPTEHVNALVKAAEQLKKSNLSDPLVKALAVMIEAKQKADDLQKSLERLAEIKLQGLAELKVDIQAKLNANVKNQDVDAWKALGDQLARATQIVNENMTAEEKRHQAIAEATTLYRAGQIDLETYNRVLRANADAIQQSSEATQRNLDDAVGAWGQALAFLSEHVGGFFKYLSQLASQLQQAQQFGASVKAGVSALGGSASAAGAAGGVATVVAVFAVVYDFVDKMIKASRAARLGNAGEFGVIGGREYVTELDHTSQQAARAIRDAVRQFADALGITFDELAKLGVKISKDGKHIASYVNGEFLGMFNSVEEAIQEALRVALSSKGTVLSGLSDLMRQGLERFTAPDLEELQRFLGQLREISNMSLAPAAVALQETIRHLNELREALRRVGNATPEVVQGLNAINEAEAAAFSAWRDSITGREKTRAELLAEKQREAQIFNAQKALEIARLKLEDFRLKQELEAFKIQARQQQMRARLSGSAVDLYQTELEGFGQYIAAKGGLLQVELSMYEQQLLAMQAQIAAIEELIRQLDAIPDIDPGKIRLPGSGRGSESRDTFRQRLQELREAAMTDAARGLAELNRQLEEFRRQAAAAHATAAERAEGERLLREAYGRTLREAIAPYLRDFGLTDFQRQLDEARRAIADQRAIPAGQRRLAGGPTNWELNQADANVTATFLKQLDDAIAGFRGLGEGIASVHDEADTLRKNLMALGLDAEETAKRLAEIGLGEAFKIQQGQLSVMDRLFNYLKGSAKYAEQIKENERKKLELDFLVIEAQLKAWGIWNAATQGIFNDAYKAALAALNGPLTDTSGFADEIARRQEAAAQAQQEAARRFAAAIDKLIDVQRSLRLDDQLSYLNPREQVEAARQRLADLEAQARAGNVDAMEQLAQAIPEYLREYLDAFGRTGGFLSESQRLDDLITLLSQMQTFSQGNVVYGAPFGNPSLPVQQPSVPVSGGGTTTTTSSTAGGATEATVRQIGMDVSRFGQLAVAASSTTNADLREIADSIAALVNRLNLFLSRVA